MSRFATHVREDHTRPGGRLARDQRGYGRRGDETIGEDDHPPCQGRRRGPDDRGHFTAANAAENFERRTTDDPGPGLSDGVDFGLKTAAGRSGARPRGALWRHIA